MNNMPEVKEKEPVVSRRVEQVSEEVVQQPEVKERSLEVESVIEKIERDMKGDQKKGDVQDDVSTTVVPTSDDQPAVTLPVSQDDVVQGQKLSVWESLRWLAELAIRQIKKFHGRVVYREPKGGE